jgi:hypothetical protein
MLDVAAVIRMLLTSRTCCFFLGSRADLKGSPEMYSDSVTAKPPVAVYTLAG